MSAIATRRFRYLIRRGIEIRITFRVSGDVTVYVGASHPNCLAVDNPVNVPSIRYYCSLG
jgi:hypothetical protein